MSISVSRLFSLVTLALALGGCPQGGFWPDDIPRPSEGEGEAAEGEGEGEGEAVCDPACTDGTSCRDGQCLADDLFCSATNPAGVCANTDETCVGGVCVADDDACSIANPDGVCAGDLTCTDGVCTSNLPCTVEEPNGFCEGAFACVDGRCQDRDRLCTVENPTGLCPSGFVCDAGDCSPVEAQCGCVGTEVCVDGVCRVPADLCTEANPAGLCEDGGACVAGACVDVGARCSAQNPTGVCPPGALCDDGVCTGIDGAALCNDDNECTVDAFDTVRNRCAHTARTGACDDGNACTDDTCNTDGVCTGTAIGGCVVPPELDPVVSPTNVGALTLAGTKPAGASVVINDLTAVPESPDTRWSVTVNLVPGDNVYVVKSVDQGESSATRELHVVFDITPPKTRATPDGGKFLVGITATIATDEPATVFFTADGTEPDANSASFASLKQIRISSDTTLRFRARDLAGNFEVGTVDVEFEVTGRGTSWRTAPSLPEGLIHAASAVIDADGAGGGSVVIIGGSDGSAPQAGVTSIDIASGAESTLASLSAARSGLAAVVHDGELYAIGGENAGVPKNTVEVLEGAAWVTKAPMPSTRHALSAVSIAGQIFVFGGKTNGGAVLTNVEAYDAGANSWSNAFAQMPRARAGGRAVVVGGLVYLVGGEGAAGALIAEVDVYDPESNTWTTRASLPTPRTFAGVGVIQNVGGISTGSAGIVVAGGLGAGGIASATVEEYLIDEDRWLERAPLDAARHASAAIEVVVGGAASQSLDTIESEVWLLGGQIAADVVESSRAFRSPRDWARRLADLPSPRFLAGAGVVDEVVYVIGGRSFREEAIGWAYDPETGSVTDLPALQSVQSGLAVVASGGRVFAIGGADSFGNAVPTNRAYDPAERRFIELQPMTSARSQPAAVAVGEKIVVVGGDNGGALQTVEVYDTVTNTWSSAPLLPGPRAGAMAVERDGNVIVIGGVDGAGAAVASLLQSTRNAAGDITGWDTLPGSIPVAAGSALIERDHLVVVPGRVTGALEASPFVYDLVGRRVLLRSAIAELVPALESRAAVRVLGKLLLLGGTDDAPTPAGAPVVVEARLSCLNGALDPGETDSSDRAGDSEAGCPPLGFRHSTGLGGVFFNEFPTGIRDEPAAIRACNAHFGVTTCRRACTSSAGTVSRDGACQCTEPLIWIWGNSTHASPAGVPGDVSQRCDAVFARWD